MFVHDRPQLKVIFENHPLDIEDALKQQPDLVLEALIDAFLLCPVVDEDTITRIQLGDRFRRSLQASRQTTPYRLHTIISECKTGRTDKLSLEGRFYAHGGVRAVAALAAAATDDKQVVRLLKRLPDLHLQALLKSIDGIRPHRDFVFIVETIDRKKPARLSKRKNIPAPRSRRRLHSPHSACSTPQKSADGCAAESKHHMDSSAQDCRPGHPEGSVRESIDTDKCPHMSNAPLPKRMTSDTAIASQAATQNHLRYLTSTGPFTTSPSGVDIGPNKADPGVGVHGSTLTNVRGAETGNPPTVTSQEIHSTEAQCLFSQGNNGATGITSGIVGLWQDDDNYRIDLDSLHTMPRYDVDVGDPNFENYGIDLDSFSVL